LPVEFAQTFAGAGVIAGVAGAGLIVTLQKFWAEQPEAFVTVSVRPTVPEAPAVYVIVWTFVALVIVPFVIDQSYVAAPAGPEAVLPVEAAQTWVGTGVIVGAAGSGLIGTINVAWPGHDAPFVTFTVSVTFPEAPAV
jgi:hypothetical protein